MVVSKPGEVPVLPGGFFYSNTIISILKEKYQGMEVIAPVHRLGRGTTGALIISIVCVSCLHYSRPDSFGWQNPFEGFS